MELIADCKTEISEGDFSKRAECFQAMEEREQNIHILKIKKNINQLSGLSFEKIWTVACTQDAE